MPPLSQESKELRESVRDVLLEIATNGKTAEVKMQAAGMLLQDLAIEETL